MAQTWARIGWESKCLIDMVITWLCGGTPYPLMGEGRGEGDKKKVVLLQRYPHVV